MGEANIDGKTWTLDRPDEVPGGVGEAEGVDQVSDVQRTAGFLWLVESHSRRLGQGSGARIPGGIGLTSSAVRYEASGLHPHAGLRLPPGPSTGPGDSVSITDYRAARHLTSERSPPSWAGPWLSGAGRQRDGWSGGKGHHRPAASLSPGRGSAERV